MDFDEYEYLEKAVESDDLTKEPNGSTLKNKSTEKEKRRTEEDDGHTRKRRRSLEGEISKSERSSNNRECSRKEKSRDRGGEDQEWENDRAERINKDKELGRGRESRDRDKGRDQERDKDRQRDRDHKDGDRRRQSVDREKDSDRESDRQHSADRSHSRSRDYDRYDGDVNRNREPQRHNRYPRERREKKEEVVEAEADLERDQRTVFASQISLKADERDVYDFFSRAGRVRDVRLIMDRNTRRSKGVGYIEFFDAISVPMAIALTGQLIRGQPVMVKPSEAEKNLVQSTSSVSSSGGLIGPYSGGARRLYVGNLHYNMTEIQLRQVFEPFGIIELVQLPTEPDTGHCKGYGFIQYAKLEDARNAQQSLNGILQVAGLIIKVVPMTDQQSLQDPALASGEFDDDDGGGLSLTARSRTLLMQKLDRTGTVSSVVSTAITPTAFNIPTAAPIIPSYGIPGMVGMTSTTLGSSLVEPIGTPTDCLLLKNMFDPATEAEPDFDLDIKDEVQSESAKYGTVKHIFVDKNSLGHVYLRFTTLSAAINAQRSLHGRWFAGTMITTSFMTPQAYELKFPESR